MDGYIIQWRFEPKTIRYWSGFAGGYSTDKKSARSFPTLKAAEIEAGNIMDSRKIGASPRRIDARTFR
jgi:hypothetical protein